MIYIAMYFGMCGKVSVLVNDHGILVKPVADNVGTGKNAATGKRKVARKKTATFRRASGFRESDKTTGADDDNTGELDEKEEGGEADGGAGRVEAEFNAAAEEVPDERSGTPHVLHTTLRLLQLFSNIGLQSAQCRQEGRGP